MESNQTSKVIEVNSVEELVNVLQENIKEGVILSVTMEVQRDEQ